MAKKYKVEISKDMADLITEMGYTPEGWLKAQLESLIEPLTNKEAKRLLKLHHQKELDDFKVRVKSEIKVGNG
jgi:hypothetical protein